MEISFDVPDFINDVLREMGDDPNLVVKELVLVGWFRQELITHAMFAAALGLDPLETDALLKRHAVEIPAAS